MGTGTASQELELVTDSLVRLLEAQAALADQLPTTGYINRVLSTMNTKGEASQKPPIMLLHQIAKSQVCVEALANCDCVSPLHRAMKLRKDLLVVVCETFNRMFAFNHDSLVSQALSCGLVKDLLNILNSRLDNIPNASSCKAQVVKALKAMQRSLVYGDQVTQLLNGSPIWKDYEQQKHDLFLDNEKPLALTQSSTVGYLTMNKSALPSVPPPIDDNQDNSEGLLG